MWPPLTKYAHRELFCRMVNRNFTKLIYSMGNSMEVKMRNLWIIDTLNDMIEFAEGNSLELTLVALEKAKLTASQEIGRARQERVNIAGNVIALYQHEFDTIVRKGSV